MKKRIFLLVAVLCLCLALLPTSAFAAETEIEYYSGANGATTKTKDYTELTSENAGSVTSGIYYINSTFAVDGLAFGGGTTLVLGSGATLTVNGTLYCGGNLTVTTEKGATGANLVAKGNDASDGSYGIKATGSVSVYAGEVKATGGTANGYTTGFSYGICAQNGMTVSGGTVEATGGAASMNSYGINVEGGGMTVSGGEVKATGVMGGSSYGIRANGGMTVSGGTVAATGGDITSNYADSYGIYADSYSGGDGMTVTGGTVTATGGTITAEYDNSYAYSCGILAYRSSGDGMTVTGGTVNAIGGTVTSEAEAYSYGINVKSGGMTVSDSATVNATGGTATGGTSVHSYGIYANSDMTISGGTVKLTVGSTVSGTFKTTADGKTLADYLADGTAFEKDSSVVNSKVAELTNVKVVAHTSHDYDNTGADSTGKCGCGKQLPVKAEETYGYDGTINCSVGWGETLADAVGASEVPGGVNPINWDITLYGDAAGNYSILPCDFNLYLNGHEYTGTLTHGQDNCTLTVGNSSATVGTISKLDYQRGYLKLNAGVEIGELSFAATMKPADFLADGTAYEMKSGDDWAVVPARTVSSGSCVRVVAHTTHDYSSGTCACGANENPITYITADSTTETSDYTVLTSGNADSVSSGIYYVNSDLAVDGLLYFDGNTVLVLGSDATLTVNGTLQVDGNLTVTTVEGATGAKLAVTGITSSSGSYGIRVSRSMSVYAGEVEATGGAADDINSYGISANEGLTVSGSVKVTATGGEVTVRSASLAGIRASYGIYTYSGNVTVSGSAEVTANGGEANANSYGICAKNGSVTVSGGTVTATGGTVTATGGTDINSYGIYADSGMTVSGSATVTAKGGNSTDKSYGIYAKSDMTVSGGTVTATGGKASSGSYGIHVYGGMTVSGGTVTATGGEASGFSYGIYAKSFGVNGGTVTATGGDVVTSSSVAGSYGLEAEGITITNGEVTATAGTVTNTNASGSTNSYGIHCYFDVTISGGTVKLTVGSTIGGTLKTTVTDATLADYLADGTAYQQGGSVVDGKATELSNVKVVAHTHDFSSNATTCACGFTCDHSSYDTDTGKCSTTGCGYQYPVKAVAYDSSDAVVATFWNTDIYKLLTVNSLFSTEGAKRFTITLYGDVTATSRSMVVLREGVTVTLDLNGHSYDNTDYAQISAGCYSPAADGFLTVIDSSAAKTGKITGTVGVESSGSTLTLKSGSYGRVTWIDGFTPADLLTAGYAFQKTDDSSMVVLGSVSGTELTNVKVVACTSHSIGTDGKCEYCTAQAVAQIGSNYYTSFEAAYNAAQSGDTITLLANEVKFTSADKNNPEISKSITIDLNGKTLIGQFTNTTVTNGRVGVSGNDVEVTIKGGGTVGGDGLQITNGGALTLDGVTVSKDVLAFNGGKLTVNSATITERLSVGEYTSRGSDTLTMSGGSANTLAVKSGSAVTLTGGTFDNVTCGDNVSIGSLPAEGYAFKTTSGTWYDAYNNSDATSINEQVTVTAAPVTKVKLTGNTSYTYGDTVSVTATFTLPGTPTGEIEYTCYLDDEVHGSGTKNPIASLTATITCDSLSAGKHTFHVVATKDGYTVKSNTLTVDVAKAALDEDIGDYSSPGPRNTTYDGQAQALLSNYSSPESGTLYYSLDSGETKNWSTDIPTAKNAGDYTVYWYVKGDENHLDTKVASVKTTISPRKLTPENAAYSPLVFCTQTGTLTYNGQPQMPTFRLELKTKGDNNMPSVFIETLVEGTDYTVSVRPQTNAGERYEITFTGKGNYTGTATRYWSIAKAAAPTLTATDIKTVFTVTSGTADLSRIISGILSDAGTIGYAVDTESLTHGGTASIGSDGKTFSFEVPKSGAVGSRYEFPVVVSSTNYADVTVNVTVELTAKENKTLAVTMTGWTHGEAASKPGYDTVTGAGTAAVAYKSKGAEDYTYRHIVPTDAGDYTVKVSFETATEIWSGTADFTIARATPTGEPKYTAITTSGKTLSDAKLTAEGGTFSVPGTVTWIDADSNELDGTTEVKANTAYQWLFAPTDSVNYNTLSGTITLWHQSSSGSFSGTNSTTVKNDDGSTTTTTTDKTTGTVTETTRNPNGVTGTTVTDKNGDVTGVSASVPASAAKDGATVTLPIDEVNAENGTEIRIDVPSGGATVEIPVKNPTPGTVIVIVDKDGNETVVPTTKRTENGVSITLTESATVKVIENGKTFSDVKSSNYFHDAVQWAYSRGITGGKTATTFGPHDSCTRAQLVTFLWRAAGCPVVNYAMNFADVGDAYYTEAVRWAASLGIVGGYGNGLFGTHDTITRQQVAAILYRYAMAMKMDVSVGEDTNILSFQDALSVSGYAIPAFQWAVGEGVINGNNGNLMPGNTCTRAQIVAMLYRLLGE